MIEPEQQQITAEDRPLVTFALVAYNQEKYIREALEGAFSQTYSPLQIILSDDCSSDRTFEIMQEEAEKYSGPHQVFLNCNSENLNIGRHVDKVARLAAGDLIIMAAGDDVSLPHRSESIVSCWQNLGCPVSVFCSDFVPIDQESKIVGNFQERTYRGSFSMKSMAMGDIRVLGATSAISKAVISDFPPMHSSVIHEDRVLPFRALLIGGKVSLIDEKLVLYRITGGVSRYATDSCRDWLLSEYPAKLAKTLPDAVQRLADLQYLRREDMSLRTACLRAVESHKAYLRILHSRGIKIELEFIRGLLAGAQTVTLFKLYLKLRFIYLYEAYCRSKQSG